MLEFVLSLLECARPFRLDSLLDLKMVLRKASANARPELAAQVMDVVTAQIQFKSPVLGRWQADPLSDMLGWCKWKDAELANALTNICEPFYRLRAWEFQASGAKGPHLKHLNDIGNALSYFVTGSVLVGCMVSQKEGCNVVGRWIGVMEHLLQLGNFHMLGAIDAGLKKHQLDRGEQGEWDDVVFFFFLHSNFEQFAGCGRSFLPKWRRPRVGSWTRCWILKIEWRKSANCG